MLYPSLLWFESPHDPDILLCKFSLTSFYLSMNFFFLFFLFFRDEDEGISKTFDKHFNSKFHLCSNSSSVGCSALFSSILFATPVALHLRGNRARGLGDFSLTKRGRPERVCDGPRKRVPASALAPLGAPRGLLAQAFELLAHVLG